MQKFYFGLIMIAFTLFVSSCASQKEITYLQGVTNGYQQQGMDTYEIKIRPDDMIAIMVNSKDPELSQMFNLPMVSYQINNTTSGIASSQNRILGYLVDKNSEINFPQLGKIKIGGMTRTELTDYIANELIANGYVYDPVVTVQYLNFKVSVMGEVNKPGTIDISSDRITLFDALSAAGDLTIYGQRDNVKIIREINGKKTVSIVDLRKANILDSPFYYLQQNDVVYVEPNKAKAGQREINSNRTIGTWASIVSVILSALSLAL